MSQTGQLRPASRSKRSTTNLSNLRLAPLSAKYSEPPTDRYAPKSPYEEAAEATLAKYTYKQGRSAPTTPGLGPDAVRRHGASGGLSRRQSMYDDESSDAANDKNSDGDFIFSGTALTFGSATPGGGKKNKGHKRSRTVGTNTPRSKSGSRADQDWLSHTSATANALLLESKGATWLSSRPSATNLAIADDGDDDDEGYEEMAALSATTTRIEPEGDGAKTPRQDRWGSRFGSRPASRHASRRGSVAAGAITPRSTTDLKGYFEQHASLQQGGAVFAEESEDETDDDIEHLTALTKDKSFGLGPYVDKIMYSMFSLPDADESGADTSTEAETAAEAKARRSREAQRRQQEKDRLVAPPAPKNGQDGDKVGIWQDANWLIGVASRAFS